MRTQIAVFVALTLLVAGTVSIVVYRNASPYQPSFARQPAPTTPAPAVSSATPSFDSATLEKYLTVEAAILGVSDQMSLYFKDEPTGIDIGINPVRSWIPASTIKAFVAVEAFRQRATGRITFDDTVTIVRQNVVPTELETDEFPRLREGTQATIRQLVEAMIIQSDNTAYNTLLDILDRRTITATLRALGLTQTTVGEKLNMDDDQLRVDLAAPGRQPNTITAKDVATLFDLLYNNTISSSSEILAIFARQKINTMIPALLPPDTVIAHKTGDWPPIYHDTGLVYKPEDPFVLSVFTNANDPAIVAQLARVAYFRSADVVGAAPNKTITATMSPDETYSRIYLAEGPETSAVLGATTDTQTGERTYTVVPGDTLWGIAAAQYGSGFLYVNIVGRNSLRDPGTIAAGTTLILPGIPGIPVPAESETPVITAGDLGITESDLRLSPVQTQSIRTAFILPGSPLYTVKTWGERFRLSRAQSNDTKIDVLLAMSRSRLGEIKREIAVANVGAVGPLLTESEEALRQATLLANASSNNEVALFKIKKMRDANFGILRDTVGEVSIRQKGAFIDAVYAFYQKQKQDVEPVVSGITSGSKISEKPIIGAVTDLRGNIATVRRSDTGSAVSVVLSDLTPSRGYNEKQTKPTTTLRRGDSIAIVGRITPAAVVMPDFILERVPRDAPIGRRGTVIEIDPKDYRIKLKDTRGNIDTIVVDGATVMKAKDTAVSLTGIKVGSTITVVGNIISAGGATPVQQETPRVPSLAPTEPTRTQPVPVVSQQGGGKDSRGQTVTASTVTVEKNASGKNEKVEQAKPSKTESKPESKPKEESKPKRQPEAPPPKKSEIKPEEKKK